MNNASKKQLRFVKGIGEKRAKLLMKLGVSCVNDLVNYFPYRYEDRRGSSSIRDLLDGEKIAVKATVATEPRTAYIRKGMEITRFRVLDESALLEIVYFNQKYAAGKIHVGEEYLFFGTVKIDAHGKKQMINPVVEKAEEKKEIGCIVPIYRLTTGLSQKVMRTAIESVLQDYHEDEFIPDEILKEYQLYPRELALREVHFPGAPEEIEESRKRMIFEELFILCLGMEQLKDRRRETAFPMTRCDWMDFEKNLPFKLTNAQKRCIREISEDLESGICMNRLLQGDVGSGKTAVAAAAAWMVYENGGQTALMVPTELLAEQHFQTLHTLLNNTGMRIGLLTGSMTEKEKKEIYKKLMNHEIDLCVGTHALLSEGVSFSHLDLVITDEQHRFGVRQRASLAAKGEQVHILVMSATPIPRTLALILYGDLSVSKIDELPPGRKPIETYLIDDSKRKRIEAFIRKLVEQGRQIYIVCPLVEDEEEEIDTEKKAAENYAKHLKQKVFPDFSIGVVHGRMKARDKEKVMRDFHDGNLQILVATTVIEVGVDVPNAVMMLVENAERFGLSQLHQLRGRVGRGDYQSYCILVSNHKNENTLQRLKAMTKTNDGFEIAEQDLVLRGPGNFFGSEQHGLPPLGIASQNYDLKILEDAQHAASKLQKEDWSRIWPELSEKVQTLFSEEGDIFN